MAKAVKIDKDGVKVGEAYWPFAYDEGCAGCRFMRHVGEVEGVAVDRDVCRMTPDDEDKFLFGDVPEDKVPPCMKE